MKITYIDDNSNLFTVICTYIRFYDTFIRCIDNGNNVANISIDMIRTIEII
jgi:hypothetical protein